MSQRRSAKPVRDQQEDRDQRGDDGEHGGSGDCEPRQPVERALQDEGGGVLVDHERAFGAAHVGSDEVALHRGG